MKLAQLAAAVTSRSTTAEALVRESLRRIDEFDAEINSVVARRDELALAEARALDARIAAGEPVGPLAGIPLLVKDLEDVAGMVTTQGSVPFANHAAATRDGVTPGRLRAAGAIVVGKTNLPEFACEGYTANLLFGVTRNPWAPEWSPGGSSGGSGAALAAALAPMATGTDGGGSVRIPAAFCGLVGLKATRGAIGRRPAPDWIDLSADGPMANTVDDLRLLFSVMLGPEPGDPDSQAALLPPPPAVSRLLAVERTAYYGPLPPEVAAAFSDAVRRLSELVGVPAVALAPADVFPDGNADEDWFVIAAAEHVNALGRDWVTEHLGELHPAAADFLHGGLAIDIDAYLSARRRRFDYTARLDALLGEAGLMLSPTNVVAGFAADGGRSGLPPTGARGPEDYNTAVQNMTGHPAVSLPAGLLPNGVPFGLQVTAPRGQDNWLIDLATAWEAVHPWPLTAPGYEPFAPPR